jgi:RNA 2',3'-cyclic 3'-phosphodiesterase
MRLFTAIDFKEIEDYLIKLQNNIDSPIAQLKKVSVFHLTLKFLGKVSEDKASIIKEKLKQVKFNPFSLTLDKIGVFPNENFIRVIWVSIKQSDEVIQLQKDIESALEEFKLKKDFEFQPHITLARVKTIDNKEEFIKNIKKIKVEEKTIEIKDFKLIKSTLTQKGPVYEDVAVFS